MLNELPILNLRWIPQRLCFEPFLLGLPVVESPVLSDVFVDWELRCLRKDRELRLLLMIVLEEVFLEIDTG